LQRMLNSRVATKNKTPNIRILTIRDQKVVLDTDLAGVYGVSTRALNQAVRRNKRRFPVDFAFRLSSAKYEAMRSQIVIASSGRVDVRLQVVTGSAERMRSQTATASKRNISYRPWVSTEHGALQAANILRSDRAIAMSVYVIRAFIERRE